MTLKKDDLVEVVKKDDDGNGWWLVKKNGTEGWTPSNYLELVPKEAAAPAPPPPPPPRAPRAVPPPPAPAAIKAAMPKSIAADASAKPVSVFPGMAAANGSATPWKKTPSAVSDSNGSSRPSSTVGSKPPPPIAAKPKPAPPIAAKPPPKIPGKPPVPAAPRPGTGAARPPPPRSGAAAKMPAAPAGQMDLAAMVSTACFCLTVYTHCHFDSSRSGHSGNVVVCPLDASFSRRIYSGPKGLYCTPAACIHCLISTQEIVYPLANVRELREQVLQLGTVLSGRARHGKSIGKM